MWCLYIVLFAAFVMFCVFLAPILLKARLEQMGINTKQGLCEPSQKQLPPLTPQKDVVQQALFPHTPATWNSGMAWNFSWRLPQLNKGTVVFDATLDQGLMVGFSSAMSDTGGGYLVHILAPDKDNVNALYGVSDMLSPALIHTFATTKMDTEPRKHRYTVSYDNGHFKLQNEDGVIFDQPYPFANQTSNAPQQNINYFGFGTSSVGAPRSIDAVNILQ
jgi:hypothetical protein